MGARPLRRVIQQSVEDRLSDSLLAHEFADNDTVMVDVNEAGEIYLRHEQQAPAQVVPVVG